MTSWVFWGLGIAGYIGLDIPYLTDDKAFLFFQGNEREGGWGFNYAMVIALGMTVASFVVSKVLGRRDEEEREDQSLNIGGVVVEDAPPPSATWTCECGRSNPSDNFNCATCGVEQPPLSSGRWET